MLCLSAFLAIAAIAHAASSKYSPGKNAAFVSGLPMNLKGRQGALALSACAQRGGSAIDRRFLLASFALGLSGALPRIAGAQQLSAKEAEEYAKLLEQVTKFVFS